MALDPAVGAFLQSLQQAGLNQQQIGNLATMQNDPTAWMQQYHSDLSANNPNAPQAPKAPQPVQSTGLPFNEQYDQQYRALEGQQQQAQSDTDLIIQRLKQAQEEGQANLGQNRDTALQSVQDRMASQGILHSGITANEQGKVGQEYAQRIQQLTQSGQQQEEDARRQLQQMLQGFAQQRSGLQEQQAREQQQAAQQAAQQNAANQAQYEQAQQQYNQQMDAYSRSLRAQPSSTPTGQYQAPVVGATTPEFDQNVASGAISPQVLAFLQAIAPK